MADEIIEEVRTIKDSIATAFNYDLRALFREIQRGEAELEAKGIRLIPQPNNSAIPASTALQRTRLMHHHPS